MRISLLQPSRPRGVTGSHAALRTQSRASGVGVQIPPRAPRSRRLVARIPHFQRGERGSEPRGTANETIDERMHAGIAQVVERAVETRESLIRSQVPAPKAYPRSSTDERRATNAMGGGSIPSEGAKVSNNRRGPAVEGYRGQTGSNPAARGKSRLLVLCKQHVYVEGDPVRAGRAGLSLLTRRRRFDPGRTRRKPKCVAQWQSTGCVEQLRIYPWANLCPRRSRSENDKCDE